MFGENPNFTSEIPTDSPNTKQMLIDNFEGHECAKFQQLLADIKNKWL